MSFFVQINGCRGETKTIDEIQRRVEYDLEYINNWSNALDVKILFYANFLLTIWRLVNSGYNSV